MDDKYKEALAYYKPPFKYIPKVACIWSGGGKCLDVRGWGMLTGGGANNLPPEKAAAIQDAFGQWVVSALELAAKVQDGSHVVAPVEPTQEMLEAARFQFDKLRKENMHKLAEDVPEFTCVDASRVFEYKAMIAAAPEGVSDERNR